MTNETTWGEYMKSLRGHWAIDPVHNGANGRLLAFHPNTDDHTCGVYVELNTHTGKCSAGMYEGAIPHLGDAAFFPKWERKFPPTRELAANLFVRLGLSPSIARI